MLSVTGVGTDSGTVTRKQDHMGVLNTFLWVGVSLMVDTTSWLVIFVGIFPTNKITLNRLLPRGQEKYVGIFPTFE